MDLQSLMQLPPGGLEVALLVLVRLSGMFIIAPVFSNQSVPMRMRVGLAVIIAFLILPVELAGPRPALPDANALTLAIGRELMVGLTLGFVAMTFLWGAQFAGHMLGLQMGFGMNQMFDPTTHSNASELSILMTLLATLSFLMLDAHHWLLAAVWRSYQAIPVGATFGLGAIAQKVLAATMSIFDIALTIMLPISGALLVIEMALAILNRTMPQLNVFALGSGFKILLGLASLAAIMPLIGQTFDLLVERLSHQLVSFF